MEDKQEKSPLLFLITWCVSIVLLVLLSVFKLITLFSLVGLSALAFLSCVLYAVPSVLKRLKGLVEDRATSL